MMPQVARAPPPALAPHPPPPEWPQPYLDHIPCMHVNGDERPQGVSVLVAQLAADQVGQVKQVVAALLTPCRHRPS